MALAVTPRAVVQVDAPYDPTCYTEAGCGAAEYGALWAKLNGATSSAPSSARGGTGVLHGTAQLRHG